MKNQVPRVALLIETSRGYGRSFLEGIVRYANLHGPWDFYLHPGDFFQALPEMEQWGGTGIIARIETAGVAQAILDCGLPTIALDVSQNVPLEALSKARLSEVASDSVKAAEVAAEHLLEQGLHNFAYVGEANRAWSGNRQKGFVNWLQRKGLTTEVYKLPESPRMQRWEHEQPLLAEWIAALPKPVGVMASNDDRGRQVLEACRLAGVSVPMEVAVIGVDNDALLCKLSNPPLSSVELNAEEGGFRAAALLDGLMSGRVTAPERLFVKPSRVVQRRSTEFSAVDDPIVAAALHTIQTLAAKPITINEIVAPLKISRRSFEIRFRRAVGRTPHEELRRARLVRAKQLLVETSESIDHVAVSSGFCSAGHLCTSFVKEFNVTPAQFRRHQKEE